jgi:drug/metabolite transporter (DMT)-like permease
VTDTVEPTQPTTPQLAPRSDRDAFAPLDWGLFTAIGLIWGSSFLLIDIGLDHFHPGLITWARVSLGAAALAVLPRSRGHVERDDWRRITVLSVVWVTVPFTLFPLAEEHITSAVTGMLNGAVPFFAGLIGGLFFDRVPRGPQRLGILVGFVGIVLVSLGSSGGGGNAAIGVAMVLAATFCYGLATNLATGITQRYGSLVVTSRMLALAAVWTAPFGLWGLARSEFAVSSAAAVTVLGVLGTAVAYAFMGTLVSRVGATRASFITYLIPVVALFLGVAFRDEAVEAVALVGVVLVIGGAVLASRQEA